MLANILLLPLFGCLTILVFGRYVSSRYILVLNLVNLLVAIGLVLYAAIDICFFSSPSLLTFQHWITCGIFIVEWQLLFDSLSIVMALLVLVISTFVHFYSWEYMGSDLHFLRFISYLSIFTFFMLVFVTAGNFFQMFAGWEGVGLSSYLLINFWYTRAQANKSAMKAIIVNRISDSFLYFSIFLAFFCFGTLDYSIIFSLANVSQLDAFWLNIMLFCVFVGAVGKSAQLGLHTWLPDAMEGPTPVSALLHAATMVTAGVYLLIRCSPLLEQAPLILVCILFIGALTTFFAGTIGCFQNDIKKIIAYSTCSQLGYMFLICGLGQFNVSFFHLFNHAFFKALLFLGAGSVIHALLDEQDIRKMGGLFKVVPITYVAFFIGSLALAGIPYLTGFYSKDLLIELTFASYGISTVFTYWLALFSVFFTAFYSTRLAYYVFFGWPNYQHFKVSESGNVILFVLISLTLLSVFIGFSAKEFFVGVGGTTWQKAIQVVFTQNVFFDTELSFVFGGILAINKLFPLYITLTASLGAIIVVTGWFYFIKNPGFRVLYEFINQKWYFDIIYLNFITLPIMSFGYHTTFKLIDRGVLESFGSTLLSVRLWQLVQYWVTTFETGNLYSYVFFQLGAIFFYQAIVNGFYFTL